MLKKITEIPVNLEKAYDGRDYEHQRAFDELKDDIRALIEDNIGQAEIVVTGYAESGKLYAIMKARQEVLNEMTGIERHSIFKIHDDIIRIDRRKVDGKNHFFVTYNEKAMQDFQRIVNAINAR